MIELFRELKKISSQIRGSKNIFGYKSTVANQIYLLYCLCGNIYFTDKISKRVKFLWYVMTVFQIVCSYSIGLTYFWNMCQHIHDENKDLMLMFNVASEFGSNNLLVFGLPFVCHVYGDRIETMIEKVDNILASNHKLDYFDIEQNQMMIHARENFRLFMGMILVTSGIYISVCWLDVILFFHEDKVKNHLYYTYPPPLIGEYSSFTSYIIFNGFVSIIFIILLFEVWSIFGIVLYWNTVCCDELISISNVLDVSLRNHETSQESCQVLETDFEFTLIQCIKKFQNVTILINYLRGFTEAIASFLALAGFGFGVACLHVCLLNDMSLMLKVKFLMGYLTAGVGVFFFYWVGQNLSNSIARISFSVYSTPWYNSTKIRRHVHIFLCQTQSTTDFVSLKVYSLLLNNFSKFLQAMFSYANLLRKLTNV